jgi:uncharacterized membrane protein
MIDSKLIRKWVKDKTITEEQARKMRADILTESGEEKSSKFISVISIIGAILILVGFAWLVAKNWHQMHWILKILILVTATLAAFFSGVMLRERNHEGVGRSLITLGGLLYILSLFLISQIFHVESSFQGYAWLLLLSWTVVMLTAYLLNSPENLVVSMIAFFPWVITQYIASVEHTRISDPILSIILIFLGAGMLLFGLSLFHGAKSHRFTNIYRWWTVFYFLAIFYVLSFQTLLPVLSDYSVHPAAFSAFLVLFVVLCLGGFAFSAIYASRQDPSVPKQIMVFVGVLAILLLLILATKVGEGKSGRCYLKSCYEYGTESECSSSPAEMTCQWRVEMGRAECVKRSCYLYTDEASCNSKSDNLECMWESSGHCHELNWDREDFCHTHENQKEDCLAQRYCTWSPSYRTGASGGLPTSLWLLWLLNNLAFIGFIILAIWYGQRIGSTKVINLALAAFILEIISRYIGFWMDLRGYFAFSMLAILGGALLIAGAWKIPQWRKRLIEKARGNK